MIIFVNGAFGIGKTTVAKALQQALPRAMIFDPERIGYVLQRLPRWLPAQGQGTGDFQDMPMWRTWTVRGLRLARHVRPTIIVPMAFSNFAYLDEIRAGIGTVDPDVRHFCLVAPVEVVQDRLRARSDNPTGTWVHRRVTECCEAHCRPEFGDHVPTAGRSVIEIAQDILTRVGHD